ncbi:MAG: preprotein translocase subunit SecE [Acidobacteria bacterium]|nr:preprotein translocase subunit SecE [Acidobacteriota bacterium]
MQDKVKLAVAILLVIAGVAGFYALADSLMIVRIISVVAGLAAGAAVAWTSVPGKTFYAFAQESVVETRKVVWPTRKETIQTTGIVAAFVVIMAIFLWIVDGSLVWLVRLMMGRE